MTWKKQLRPILLTFVFAAGLSVRMPAQCTFTDTDTLAQARAFHTSTLLSASGNVLIAGGWTAASGGAGVSSAELYDPILGTFSPAGNMSVTRGGQTATELPNGLILIAGGASAVPGVGRSSAELYDPSTGTFTPTGNMSVSRVFHTATLLPKSGKVLIAGGASTSGNAAGRNSAELYDPNAGTFTPTGSMFESRVSHTATLLPNGMVLVAGGASAGGTAGGRSSAELFDPASGTFTRIADLAGGPRTDDTANLLQNEQVLIAGGMSALPGTIWQSAELFDPATDLFTPTGDLVEFRTDHTGTLLIQPLVKGQVLVTGGYSDFVNKISRQTAELYDPGSGMFSMTANMNRPRADHVATLLNDGRVLITGGVSVNQTSTNRTAELFSCQ